MVVTKRDGFVVDFDPDKIKKAVLKAFVDVDGEATEYAKYKASEIARAVEATITSGASVEEIQDIVERKLMASERKDVAHNYVSYRCLHKLARTKYDELMSVVEEKLSAKNVQRQNANVDEISFGGRVGEASDAIFKKYAVDYRMSDMARKNHEGNMIYIHDLNSYAIGCHNCLTIPFDDLLDNGFNTRQTDVRGAQSISTALQLVAVIFQLQSLMQFGGVSAGHLDWTLVPYVRKSFYKHWKDGCKYILGIDTKKYDGAITNEMSIEDESYKTFAKAYDYAMEMTKRECAQAVEGMYHNLNTLQSRSGNQLKCVAGFMET